MNTLIKDLVNQVSDACKIIPSAGSEEADKIVFGEKLGEYILHECLKACRNSMEGEDEKTVQGIKKAISAIGDHFGLVKPKE